MAPRDDDRNRFQDDDEGGEETAVTGLSPKALYFRLQNAIVQNRNLFVKIAAAMLVSGFFLFVVWSILVINEMRRPTVEMAIEALDFGAYEQARKYANSVLKHTPKEEKEKIAAALYVYGVAMCEEVDQLRLSDKKNFYREAVDALMESRELGFLPDRSSEGYYYLGKSLYLSHNYQEAIENLNIALDKGSSRQKAINWYLANAFFYASDSDTEQGLEALDRFESLPPTLEREKQAAILMRVLMNLRMKRLDAAKEHFDTLSDSLDRTALLYKELAAGMICMQDGEQFRSYADTLEKTSQLRASREEIEKLEKQLLKTPFLDENTLFPERDRHASPFLQRLQEEQTNIDDAKKNEAENHFAEPSRPESELIMEPVERSPAFSSKDVVVQAWRRLATQSFKNAIKHFDNVKRQDTELLEFYRQAAFLEALCYEHLGQYERAQEKYSALIRTFPGTSEAIVSQFRWGYIEHLIKKNHDLGIASLVRFFEMLKQHDTYENRWMTLSDIAEIGLRETQNLIDSKQYDKAAEILEYFCTIVPEERQARLFAHIYSQWGEQLENQTRLEPFDQSENTIRNAREKFRQAGYWYAELARWTFATSEYLNNLWTSAEYYERGRSLAKSIELYRLYLDHDILQRQALAHYHIGELLFELNEIDAAVKELRYCIENYPNDPILEEARLVLAQALQEKSEWSQAVSLLKENLDGKYAPNSDVYRNSIYELGRVYDRMGNLDATIRAFDDVLQLYSDDPRTAEAHYMIAKANLDKEQKINVQFSEAPLQSQRDTARQMLAETRRQALSHLKQARAILLKEEENGLDAAEQRMLRNTFFMIGRLLTAMGEQHYEESVQENQNTIARYMSHPDVLQAYLQLARVYQLQGNTEQAEKTRKQAQALLPRFQAAKAFQQETVYTEQQWSELLGTQ